MRPPVPRAPRRAARGCVASLLALLAACASTGAGGTGGDARAAGDADAAGSAEADAGADGAEVPLLDPLTPPAPAAREGLTRGGTYFVVWEPVPDPIPVNEPFELFVTVYDAADRETPLDEVVLHVTGWMPGHGHGMHRKARVVSRDGGRHHVRGMLFHMKGYWELNIDVTRRYYSERVVFPVELP